MDSERLLKADRIPIVAIRVNPGPSVFYTVDTAMNRVSELAKKRVFRHLHVSKKISKVYHSCHVGIGKLNTLVHCKFV